LPRRGVAAYPPVMSHGGSSRRTRGVNVRIKDDAAKRAQNVADRLACEAWNERLRQLGGPLQPSPSIRAAVNGGYPFLRVACSALGDLGAAPYEER
jgi:hypothetical protein